MNFFAIKSPIARSGEKGTRALYFLPERAIAFPGGPGGGFSGAPWFFLAAIFLTAWSAHGITLQEKQSRFAHLAAQLVFRAEEMGYEVTLGEVWRSVDVAKFQVKANAEKGIGIVNSLHRLRLAIDINLFRNKKFLTATSDYAQLGEWWESQSSTGIRCRWGGRFKRSDGNHFSVEHEGRQ